MASMNVKCNKMFLNLLLIKDNAEGLQASAYIREFFDLKRCDEYSDTAPRRDELQQKVETLSPGGLQRILDLDETEKDEKAAAQAMLHYDTWHSECLAAELTLSS